MTYRRLKNRITALLQADDMGPSLRSITHLPVRQSISPLFSLLYHPEPIIRWRAVTAIGAVVAGLADEDPEAARVYVRRLMWQLNDESGGIGWGAPEAMGDIMARSRTLAEEYGNILLSYMDPWGNFLEHEPLQPGVLWAVGRLGRSHPHLVQRAGSLLTPYLSSGISAIRGLAAWAAGPLQSSDLTPVLERLLADGAVFTLYWEDRLHAPSVGSVAAQALRRFSPD